MFRTLMGLRLLATYALMLGGLTIFMAGYFRARRQMSLPDDDTAPPISTPPPFDRVVFMVVDALRRSVAPRSPTFTLLASCSG